MKKLIILRGAPACGKSTYAKELLRKNPGLWKRVNRDAIRKMLDDGTHWDPTNEKLVTQIRDFTIKTALQRGYNVISDDTNLPSKVIKDLRKIAESVGDVTVEEKFFDVDLKELLRRDSLREKKVGDEVVKKFYKKYINKNFIISKPRYYEPKTSYTKLVQDPKLPLAIMCDVDGTVAKMVNRGPYDWDKVDEDIVNEPVAEVIRQFYNDGVAILILTARDGVAKGKTEKWLKDNDIPYDELFIKPKYDSRKDSINKREIFDNHIRGKYNVLFVMDDRDQVVQLWRELGLTCFQVDDGNF